MTIPKLLLALSLLLTCSCHTAHKGQEEKNLCLELREQIYQEWRKNEGIQVFQQFYKRNDELAHRIIGEGKHCYIGLDAPTVKLIFGEPNAEGPWVIYYKCRYDEIGVQEVPCLTFYLGENKLVDSLAYFQCGRRID